MEETINTCDNCEMCKDGCTMHEGASTMACDKCESCADGCTKHEGE